MNLYKSKLTDYFSSTRNDILEIAPPFSERVLEIGCGSGHTLDLLKKKNLCKYTVGIELFKSAAQDAKRRVDEVYQLDVEGNALPLGLGKFNLILILDVLEHLVDPWALLEKIKNDHIMPGGSLIVSLPNVRHFSCVFPLFFRGEFEYKERGILDKTHLRYFTKKSGRKMIEESGFTIQKTKATSLDLSLKSGKLNLLTLGVFSDFLASQYIYLVAPEIHITR